MPDRLQAFSWGFVLVTVGGVILYVCGVCHNDSIVGWSAGSDGCLLGSSRLRLVLVLFPPRPPASLISVLELSIEYQIFL